MIELVKNQCRVRLSSERGAIVTSLRLDGEELLYLDPATFDDREKNVRGGIPVLFPICGPLKTGEYEFGGSRFSMKQHGFARQLEWRVTEQKPDTVTLELVDNPTTREQYPFRFRYRLQYRALSSGLRIEQTVDNLDRADMPVQMGFHPYFQVGDKEKLRWELPVTRFDDNKSEDEGDFQGFDFSRPEIDWAFPKPTEQSAALLDHDRGLKFQLTYSEDYEVLVFWTLADKPFVCLEPWTSGRFAFPDKSVSPGNSWCAWVQLEGERI